MRAFDKRLEKLRVAVNAAPVLPHVMEEAYEWFWMFGELYDEDHIAAAVIQKALRGGGDEPATTRRGVRLTVATEAGSGDMMTVREPLFEEALHESPYVREIARAAIGVEVAHGGNVESPGFGARHGLPVFGTVGMHVLGYPAKYVAPPYEFQGERILTLYDDLRARIDQRNPKWFDPIGDAMFEFRTKGELPSDEFLRDFAVVDAAIDGLRANKRGRDVREVMAWFYDALFGKDEKQREALTKLCNAAREGRLP
jgi:hypothetical protein